MFERLTCLCPHVMPRAELELQLEFAFFYIIAGGVRMYSPGVLLGRGQEAVSMVDPMRGAS